AWPAASATNTFGPACSPGVGGPPGTRGSIGPCCVIEQRPYQVRHSPGFVRYRHYIGWRARDKEGAVAGDRRAGGAPSGLGAVGVPGRPRRRYDDARTAAVRDILRAVISARVTDAGRARLDILDAGGGTGGFAVPLAGLGHNVTVIDPSPDSLAAAE